MFRPGACWARLLQICRRRGRSREDAEDLIQEAFVRLYEYCRGTEVQNKEGFLAQTVSNLAVDQHRRLRSASLAIESVEEIDQRVALVDLSPGPERILSAQQRLDQITRILSAVSEKTCEIFLAQRAGYSYEEIAADLGISERTVRKHIARAMLLLLRSDGGVPE